jgi:OOP family OmpA-OmpF porin
MKSPRIFAAFLVAAAACAHAEGLYLGGSVGTSDWNHVGGIAGDNHTVTGKVYGGLGLSPHFGVEAGVARLGSIGDAAGRMGANAVFLDAVGTWPIADKWSLLGRAGLARADFNSSLGQETGTGLKLGAGVQYDVSRNLALRAEYERYRLNSVFDSHADVGQFSVGLKMGF